MLAPAVVYQTEHTLPGVHAACPALHWNACANAGTSAIGPLTRQLRRRVRVGVGEQLEELRGLLRAPALGVGEEEELLVAEPRDRAALLRVGLLPRPQRGAGPSFTPPMSAMFSPDVSAPLSFTPGHRLVLAEYWSCTHLVASSKLRLRVLGPPVAQVAVAVELAALVVEAVRELVADGARAGVADVHRRVEVAREERRLELARPGARSRSATGRSRRSPSGGVICHSSRSTGLPILRSCRRSSKRRAASAFGGVRGAGDLEVVDAPLVGVADLLVVDLGELRERRLARRSRPSRAAPEVGASSPSWIASTTAPARAPSSRRRTWPRRTAAPAARRGRRRRARTQRFHRGSSSFWPVSFWRSENASSTNALGQVPRLGARDVPREVVPPRRRLLLVHQRVDAREVRRIVHRDRLHRRESRAPGSTRPRGRSWRMPGRPARSTRW